MEASRVTTSTIVLNSANVTDFVNWSRVRWAMPKLRKCTRATVHIPIYFAVGFKIRFNQIGSRRRENIRPALYVQCPQERGLHRWLL